MAKDKKEKTERKGTKKKTLQIVIFSLFCVITIQLTFLFAVIGMLPTAVAYFIDKGDNRGVFHSVFACNLSGVLAVVIPIIASGNDVAHLHFYMGDATNWLIMYASAAFGWVLIHGCPYIGAFFIEIVHGKNLGRLNGLNKRLESEWGDDLGYKDKMNL